MRKRATAVIIQDDHVLLIWRKNKKGEYYVFPGGGIEPGETPEQAVVRECMEELGITISVGQQILEHRDPKVRNHTFAYYCAILNAPSNVIEWQEPEIEGEQYETEWVPISEMKKMKVFPRVLVNRILQK